MATNSVARRIAQKELRLFFSSAVAWLFLAAFATTTLFTFFWVESFFARNIADTRPMFEWMPILLIFLCSALTMRMWSEERNSGTLEHVVTQPFSLWHFVIGKFWACFTLLLLAISTTLPLPITVALIANLDWGPVMGGYLAAVLLGAMYLSIGLFVSATTDNPIVSLIASVALCAAFYLLGSTTLTSFFDDRTGEFLRLLSSGARFENITRGIVDLRDLFYYISMSTAFLALNVYVLEKVRWATNISSSGQRNLRTATVLLLCNLVLANAWLSQLSFLRQDLTEGKLFSISQPTRHFLDELQEPLLIRGYFSKKTHPLLAPLIPQLRDLMKEYELAGRGNVQVEFVDPAMDPELEQEANSRYGISSTPFRIADRHQSSLVNAYFNVLVRYGSEHQSLGFSDLIEVRSTPNEPTEVLLRNPEYDITRAIKNILFEYHSGGDLFESIKEPVELIAYVSGDHLLPQPLLDYKNAIKPQLDLATQNSGGKFSVRFIEPEARDGKVAEQIRNQWGFKPMVASEEEIEEFYFYLTLADSKQVVQLPTEDFDPQRFRLMLDAGLKQFGSGLTKIVALSLPQVDPQMAQYSLGGSSFSNLERAVSQDYKIRMEDLSDGNVSPDTDILAVLAPRGLDTKSVFAIDQFLMRGGTVVLATSPFTAELSGGQLRLQEWESGLRDWLAYQGLEIQKTLVLDEQNTQLPAPVIRRSGGYEFQDAQLLDYPYFIDLRPPGLATHPVTANLPQVTMAWASPITANAKEGQRIAVLLESSDQSWQRDSLDIMPKVDAGGLNNFNPPPADGEANSSASATGGSILGVIVKGRFNSFFADRDETLDASAVREDMSSPPLMMARGLLEHSPESARIVLYASNDFMSDQVMKSIVAASGTQYLGPLELFMNTLDWSLQDEQLLSIRSRGHFNRTLPPMERRVQLLLESVNYGVALLLLLLLALGSWLRTILRRRHYARGLTL
jgi:ABC-2 type transport system permease protein